MPYTHPPLEWLTPFYLNLWILRTATFISLDPPRALNNNHSTKLISVLHLLVKWWSSVFRQHLQRDLVIRAPFALREPSISQMTLELATADVAIYKFHCVRLINIVRFRKENSVLRCLCVVKGGFSLKARFSWEVTLDSVFGIRSAKWSGKSVAVTLRFN